MTQTDYFELCLDRGPRIGDAGCPTCKLPKGHDTLVHCAAPEDGWGEHMTWLTPWRSRRTP